MKKQKNVNYPSFECLETLITGTSDIIRLAVIYSPPSSSKCGKPVGQFLEDFRTYLDNHSTTSGKLLLVGDFNLHVEDGQNRDSQGFLDLLSGMGLQQHVNEPTHLHGHLLDLVMTRSSEPIVKDLQVEGAVFSDHAPITFKLPWSKPPPVKKTITFRKVIKINIDEFKSDIKSSELVLNPTRML